MPCVALSLWLCAAALAGCGPKAEIREYTAPKQEFVQARGLPYVKERFRGLGAGEGSSPSSVATAPDATLLALTFVPKRALAWRFTVEGPRQRLESEADPFIDFVASQSFEDLHPRWRLPQGWREEVKSEGAEPVIRLGPDDDALTLRVAPVPFENEPAAIALGTLNVQRQMLGLPGMDLKRLPDVTQTVFLADTYSVTAFIAGRRLSADELARRMPPGHPAMGGPHGGGMGRSVEPAMRPGAAEAPADDLPFTFVKPDGWRPGKLRMMTDLVFVPANGSAAELTVMDLAPQAADWTSNVNRWRRELGLGQLTEEDVAAAAVQTPLASSEAFYVELTGERDGRPQKTLGAMAVHQGRPWFFTMKGDADAVSAQREAFTEFLGSVDFTNGSKPDGE